jgi:ribonuclease inhibitor
MIERANLVVVDLSAVSTAAELHDLLRESLGFPSWYGRNWDAFWDSITGLIEMPKTLRFLGWSQFEARLPREATHMRRCLEEMSIKYPKLAPAVVYA